MISLSHQTLLIIAPHPDDEVLGCGGLIYKIKQLGGKVYVIFMTAGDTKEYSEKGNSTLNQRLSEIEDAARYLKYDDYHIAFPGNGHHLKLDTVPQKDLITMIESQSKISLNTIKPTIVATPYLHDYNQDHRSTTKAVFAATRPTPEDIKAMPPVILGYECVSIADWWDDPRRINVYLSLSDTDLDAKITALSLYSSQIRTGYHARSLQSIKTLAYYRGMQSGRKAAEAFYCYRAII